MQCCLNCSIFMFFTSWYYFSAYVVTKSVSTIHSWDSTIKTICQLLSKITEYLWLQNVFSSMAAIVLLGLSNEGNRYQWLCSHFSPLSSFLPSYQGWLVLNVSTRKECCSHDYHVVWAMQENNDNSCLYLLSLSHALLYLCTLAQCFSVFLLGSFGQPASADLNSLTASWTDHHVFLLPYLHHEIN